MAIIHLRFRTDWLWLGLFACGMWFVSLVINFLQDPNVNYVALTHIDSITLLGETVASAQGESSRWMLTGQLAMVSLLVHLINATFTVWRREHRLDDIPDFIDFDNFGTVSFTPGVQVEIPVNNLWALRPYAHVGAGYEIDTGSWASIWYGGLKSRYLLGDSDKLRWSLLNAIDFAGYKPEYESRGQFGSAMAGLEFSHPLGRLKIGGEPLKLD